MQNSPSNSLPPSGLPAAGPNPPCAEDPGFRAQRIENIGLLATGIAHDLNNIFSPIMVGLSLLRETSNDPTHGKVLDMLEHSATRGASLVRRLMDYAKGSSGEHQPLEVVRVLRELTGVISETFPKSVALEIQIPPELWPIRGDFTQIYQVLLNLCVNARDAMPRGGRLRLQAENLVIAGPGGSAADEPPAGSYVLLQVEDSGHGIPPEVAARMWEPFFTTKGDTRGTGLGLSTVRTIITNHHGFIGVQTQVGEGTRFRLHFPALPEA